MDFTSALFATGLITFILLIVEVNFTYATKGLSFGWAHNRDPSATFSPLAQRIKGSYSNQVESTAYAVPILAAAAFSGLDSSGAETAALIYVIGRAIYSPLYISGIQGARLIGFGMGSLALLYIMYELATSGLIALW